MHPSDIRIGQNKYSTFQLIEFINSGRLELKTKTIWDERNKSISIESILLDLTMTPYYIDASKSCKWFILDGHKRLQSLYSFINNEFELEELEFYPQYNGLKFEDLPYKQRRKIEEAEFTVHTINQGVPDDVRLSLIYRIVPDIQNVINWEFRKSLLSQESYDIIEKMIKHLKKNIKLKRLKDEDYYELIANSIRFYFDSQNEIKLNSSYEELILYLNELDNKDNILSYWIYSIQNLKKINEEVEIKKLNKWTTPIWINYTYHLKEIKSLKSWSMIKDWNDSYETKFKKYFSKKNYSKNLTEIKEILKSLSEE